MVNKKRISLSVIGFVVIWLLHKMFQIANEEINEIKNKKIEIEDYKIYKIQRVCPFTRLFSSKTLKAEYTPRYKLWNVICDNNNTYLTIDSFNRKYTIIN